MLYFDDYYRLEVNDKIDYKYVIDSIKSGDYVALDNSYPESVKIVKANRSSDYPTYLGFTSNFVYLYNNYAGYNNAGTDSALGNFHTAFHSARISPNVTKMTVYYFPYATSMPSRDDGALCPASYDVSGEIKK